MQNLFFFFPPGFLVVFLPQLLNSYTSRKHPQKFLDPSRPRAVSCAVSPVTPNAGGPHCICGVLWGHACMASLEMNLLPLQISLILEASRSANVCPEEPLDKQPGVPSFDVFNYDEISWDMQKRGRAALRALKSCLSSCCLLSKVGLGQDR